MVAVDDLAGVERHAADLDRHVLLAGPCLSALTGIGAECLDPDVERAQDALADAGLRLEQPPEGWLVKAWDGDVLVDLIFRPAGGAVGDEHFERATILEVAAQSIPVASIEDVLVAKLLALSEQEPDFGPVLEIARSLREQIDWDAVRAQVEQTPFGAAFFTLIERLGIVAEPVGTAS